MIRISMVEWQDPSRFPLKIYFQEPAPSCFEDHGSCCFASDCSIAKQFFEPQEDYIDDTEADSSDGSWGFSLFTQQNIRSWYYPVTST